MLNLTELKEFLRIDLPNEDDYLNILILLSAEICKNYLRLDELPTADSVKQAMLIICGYFFEVRDGTTAGLPPVVYTLLLPYRKAEF
jgi:hypothetical protein